MAGDPAQVSSTGSGRQNLWPLALVALILGFAFMGDRGVLHMLKLSSQKDALAATVAEVEAQNDNLRTEITSLRGDRRYIERVARTELGMVREDELVFQFADGK